MITVLDNQSWGQELVTGNGQFVQDSATNVLYVVSNVRVDNSFVILKSNPVPPAPGPGASFTQVASYTFPQTNSDFDPVVTYDTVSGPNTLLHIIGTRNNPTNPRLSDLIKFTYNTSTTALTGPIVLTTASAVRNGYDMVLLANGHRVIAVSVIDATMQGAQVPPLFQATITQVAISANVLTITANNSFTQGQLVTLAGLTTSGTTTALNGLTFQILTATSTQFTAIYIYPNPQTVPGTYAPASDTGTATLFYSGENLIVFELSGTPDTYVSGTLQVIATSPDRSGNTFSSVSLVTPIDTTDNFGNGLNVEVYFESHPKTFNFKDQPFTINQSNRQVIAQITSVTVATNVLTITASNNFPAGTSLLLNGLTTATFLNGQTVTVVSSNGTSFTASFTHGNYSNTADTGTATASAPVWSASPTILYTFTGRYTDDRLTVIADLLGNRYLSQTYWTQSNHPEGIIGNMMLGTLQSGSPWYFHPIFGNTNGGSIIQTTLSVARSNAVNVAYLLQPFTTQGTLPPQGTFPAWPLQVGTLDPTTLGITNVPGFYNLQPLTWVRGTKSLCDNLSLWEIVGERAQLTTINAEAQTVPASGIVEVTNYRTYWENVSVVYATSGIALVEVESNPTKGQYAISPSLGNYLFNLADVGAVLLITYSYVSSILPIYESLFNVPPIAIITPDTLTTVYRGQPLTLDATQTEDADGDPIEFFWTENYPDPAYLEWDSGTTYTLGQIVDVLGVNYISLQNGNLGNTPSTSPTFWGVSAGQNNVTITQIPINPTAVLNVLPTIGGAATTFVVGLAAIDFHPDLTTPRHPAANVTSFQITSTTAVFTINNTPTGIPILPFVADEQVMSYSIALAPPTMPTVASVVQAGGVGGTFYFVVTYLNSVGETVASAEFGPIVVTSGHAPQVTSPTAEGNAVSYNVYAWISAGAEELQSLSPIAIGTNWVLPTTGLISGVTPPTKNKAYQTFLNDQVLTVLASPAPSGTTFAATVAPPSGYTSSSVSATGSVLPQFQYATVDIQVPYNAPPTISFPSPEWLGTFALSAVAANSGGTTVYTGTITGGAVSLTLASVVAGDGEATYLGTITGGASNAFAGYSFTVTGFTNAANNGTFTCISSTGTSLTLNNPAAISETHAATAVSNNVFAGYNFIVTGFTNPFNNGTFSCAASSTTALTLNNPNGQAETKVASAMANVAAIRVARNTQIEITPNTITDPATQLPVVYTGVADVDDVVTYTWSQVSGTPVTIVQGLNNPTLTFSTNGVNTLGEDLIFQLVLSDGVNPSAIAQCTIPVLAYIPTAPDTHAISRSIFSGNISERNTAGTWGPLDISILFSDLTSTKRNSVNDGTDRYLVISPASVTLLGGISPVLLLLRKLFTPNGTMIVDAVHTEDDYTLVLDDDSNLYRYSTAPLINTDNPDTVISLDAVSSFTFNSIFTTFSFAQRRTILLGGPDGLLLLQVDNSTLAVQGFFQISVASNLLYGADNVQFFRTANVENLRSGQVLIGTILNASATITNIQLIDNALTVTCVNNFNVGDQITLTGLTNATFLNNITVEAIKTTPTQFQASIERADYPLSALALTSVAASVGGTAVYTGTIGAGGTSNGYVGYSAIVNGFTNVSNNGSFLVTASSTTTLTLSNGTAIAETNPATVSLGKPDTGKATSSNDGSTYETLIDLAHGQIIGTWDASKLINQFVTTGEILFDPNSAYSGAPLPPVQNPPSSVVNVNGTLVTISWVQFRSDLITGYIVQYSLDGVTYNPLQTVGAGNLTSIGMYLATGSTYYFRIQALSLDGNTGYSNVESITI